VYPLEQRAASRNASHSPSVAPAVPAPLPPSEAHDASWQPVGAHDVPSRREPLWSLLLVTAGLSSVSWGGLSLIAQLEHHYVERKGLIDRTEYLNLVALAWLVPGPVGCNVAVQLGAALRGWRGAWMTGIGSVLPFTIVMTVFAMFYRTSAIASLASQSLVTHFGVVLASLISVTWVKQVRTLVKRPIDWTIAIIASVTLLFLNSPGVYAALLGAAFALGWFASPAPRQHTQSGFTLRRTDAMLLITLAVLLGLYALPLPLPSAGAMLLLWPRLAGAGLTLFGGGYSALPVLKTLFAPPILDISDSEFTLVFALSPISPGPLLNVVPFFGYWLGHIPGALLTTFAVFVPSATLVVIAQRHVKALEAHPRFKQAMRTLRVATTAFLVSAVAKLASQIPMDPAHALTATFALLCFCRAKVPVYAVYGAVALTYTLLVWQTT
jgi:chromate transporter